MSGTPTILVLHGITMNGASMLRTLGPLGSRLEALGFALLAPTAPHRLDAAELDSLVSWMGGRYSAAGQDLTDTFNASKFWEPGEHYDWLQSNTDAATGQKTYQALAQSIASLAAAINGRHVVGVLGFSQGCAMAIVLAALAAANPRFAGLRFGILLSGFKPVFDTPTPIAYPIGPFPRLLAIGDRDPIFPGTADYLASLSAAFSGGAEDRFVVPGLSHDVPSSPADVERIAQFALRVCGGAGN